jgi:hypothetical protein
MVVALIPKSLGLLKTWGTFLNLNSVKALIKKISNVAVPNLAKGVGCQSILIMRDYHRRTLGNGAVSCDSNASRDFDVGGNSIDHLLIWFIGRLPRGKSSYF